MEGKNNCPYLPFYCLIFSLFLKAFLFLFLGEKIYWYIIKNKTEGEKIIIYSAVLICLFLVSFSLFFFFFLRLLVLVLRWNILMYKKKQEKKNYLLDCPCLPFSLFLSYLFLRASLFLFLGENILMYKKQHRRRKKNYSTILVCPFSFFFFISFMFLKASLFLFLRKRRLFVRATTPRGARWTMSTLRGPAPRFLIISLRVVVPIESSL